MLDPSPTPPGSGSVSESPDAPRRLLTISQAARLLGISTGTLRNWDRSGKLKAHRNPLTAYRLYDLRDLEALRKN